MRTAIEDKEHDLMRDILKKPSYEINRVGGKDKRVALHTAVQREDIEALDILLNPVKVDCNVRNVEGMSPLMFAAKQVKIDSFERLLKDPRVNIHLKTDNSEDACDLLPAHALPFQRIRAKTAFQAAKNRTSEAIHKRRVAVIIANSDYEESSGYSCLPGVMEDLVKMRAFLNNYYIITIINAKDIEAEVREEMEDLPDSCLPVTHFQLVYSGHGLYRDTMEVGKHLKGGQKDPYGELLISVTGKACYVDMITLRVLLAGNMKGAFNPETLFCFIFDCCRNARTRGSEVSSPPLEILDKGLKMAENIKKQGYNDNILKVQSSLLGEKAADSNSFTTRLIRSCVESDGGIKVKDFFLLKGESERKCQLTGGYTTNARWPDERWPLGV